MPTIITRGAISAKAYGFGVSGGYTVSKSLRFRSSASAYLNRTPASSGSLRTWTYSAWVKRGTLGVYNGLIGGGSTAVLTSGSGDLVSFTSSDTLRFYINGGVGGDIQTTQVFRDPSAWYHVVVSVDTTQATAANRIKIYINGSQVTAFGTATYPVQNYNFVYFNVGSTAQNIGIGGLTAVYFDGYLAEVNFIDGQALTPSSFGTYDTNGVWQPIKYSGSYGTNGFYLPFTNTASTATLGNDFSGNNNTWTVNNISLTAGSTYDSMNDSPTVSSATVANYATLNPLDFQNANTYSNGNLSVSLQAATASMAFAGFGLQSGKWYWEVKTTAGTDPMLGIATQAGTLASRYWNGANSVYYYGGSGTKYVAGTGSAYGATYGTADTIGIALDLSANTITYYKNNASQGAISLPSQLLGVNIVPAFSSGTGTAVQSMNVNFGQQPFTYTPPTGFNALNTYNLPTPTIKNGAQYMAATLYTGNGTTQSVNNGTNNTIGTTFQPDFVWIKNRSVATYDHALYDVLRGAGKILESDTTSAETGNSGDLLGSFNSNGFSVNTTYLGGSNQTTNANTNAIVGWQWKANGAGITNTNGSITSTVSANTTAGFSVVTFTGTGVAGITVGHGLGVTPSMLIVKSRGTTGNWLVYHISLGNTGGVALEQTNAFAANAGFWNNVSPTSSIFTLGTYTPAATAVAYCWAAVPGYSAFGSYTNNGSTDGAFIYTGFKPRYVLLKRTDSTGDWIIFDTSRDTYNVVSNELYTDSSSAEITGTGRIDILSNGFKIRITTSEPGYTNGSTMIYAAFAENPLNYSRAR